MLDYAAALTELDAWKKDIADFDYRLRYLKWERINDEHHEARNQMLLMVEIFHRYLKNLHSEATVCRRRKKTTPKFENLYRRAAEYRDVVESNRVMYTLMFA